MAHHYKNKEAIRIIDRTLEITEKELLKQLKALERKKHEHNRLTMEFYRQTQQE